MRVASIVIGPKVLENTDAATPANVSSMKTSSCWPGSMGCSTSDTIPFRLLCLLRQNSQVHIFLILGSLIKQRLQLTYPIRAFLIDYNNNKKSHAYAYNVTILEPPRSTPAAILGTKVTTPNICCCCAQGTVKMDVQLSRNSCRSGDAVPLTVHVDNRQCKKKIENVAVRVVENNFVQSNAGTNRLWKQVLSEQHLPMVREGGEENYNCDVRIPIVTASTAIGTIVALYYTIETTGTLEGCYCCGDNHPYVISPIFVETTTPAVSVKPQIQPPAGWNPMVGPKKAFEIPINYAYMKNPNLHAMNRLYPM